MLPKHFQICKFFIAFSLLYALSDLKSLSAQNYKADDDVVIEITANDLKQLGEWPIQRRWYGILIEKLISQGADSIFLDISFSRPDIIHKESDDFFLSTLMNNPNVFIQQDVAQSELIRDSVFIMGGYSFDKERTFLPFSESLAYLNDLIVLEDIPAYSLSSHLLNDSSLPLPVAVQTNAIDSKSDLSFVEAIRTDSSLVDKNIFIYLNYAGVTAYIATSEGASLPVPLVQWQVVNHIKNGAFIDVLGHKYYITLLLIILSSMIFSLIDRKMVIYSAALLFLTGLISVLYLLTSNTYLPDYLIALLPLPVLTFSGKKVWNHFSDNIKNKPVNDSILPKLSPEEKKELENLRYQVGFYERTNKETNDDVLSQLAVDGIIYAKNSPIVEILKKAVTVAKSSVPIIITGESGTGKEELARFIHLNSNRSEQTFVAINCASLNTNLIESELFGHEEGAFTGASQSKIGRFELAHEGTIFLDEIAETNNEFQIKLLRVLQEGTFEKVGGTRQINTNARVLAATHQNLRDKISKNEFREDLYYRLNGFHLHLPPLRERQMDIEPLFIHFLSIENKNFKYSEALLEWLKIQQWKGNIRELKSAVKRAIINAQIEQRKILLPKDFGLEKSTEIQSNTDEQAEIILEMIKEHSHKYRFISIISEKIGLHRVTITEYLRGWIIYYLARDVETENITKSLCNTGLNDKQFKSLNKRVYEYKKGIHNKIKKGLSMGMNESDIVKNYFQQIPSTFTDDLFTIIQKTK